MEVDDGLDLERIVNQTDMPADRDVAMVARGRRQTAPEVLGHRVHFLTQILVKRSPLSQLRSARCSMSPWGT